MSYCELVQNENDPMGDILGSLDISELIFSPDVIARLIAFLQRLLNSLRPSSNDNPSIIPEDKPPICHEIPDEVGEIISKIRAKIDRTDSAVKKFLRKHAIWKKKRERLISELQDIVRKVDELHQDMGRSKIVSAGVSLTGVLTMLGGVALIPFSAGLSAGVAVGGAVAAVGGSAYKREAALHEYGVSESKCNEVTELIKKDEKISDELNKYMKEAFDCIADLKVEFDASKALFKLLKEVELANVDLGASFVMMLGVFITLSASPTLQADLISRTYKLATKAIAFKVMTVLETIYSTYKESGASKEIKQAISTLQEQVDKMDEIVIAVNDDSN